MIRQVAPAHNRSAGFTLIEMMIALLLFALISIAGIGLVETIIGVEHRTAYRTGRLAEIQRAMFLVRADFEQLADGPRIEGGAIELVRSGSEQPIDYRLSGGALHRIVGNADRVILTEVGTLRLRFFRPDRGWSDQLVLASDRSRPRGIEIVTELAPRPNAPSGSLRQVIELPAEP